VARAVALKLFVDLVGQPQKGQLPQRGQVADPEVVGQRRVDFLWQINVAVRQPAAPLADSQAYASSRSLPPHASTA
jgi:hypothetical protein